MSVDRDKSEIDRLERELRVRVASRLEELRAKERLTLKFLGDSAQLGQSHLSQLLAGKKNVTLRTLAKLAYALDIDASDLLKSGPVVKPKATRGRPRVRRAPR